MGWSCVLDSGHVSEWPDLHRFSLARRSRTRVLRVARALTHQLVKPPKYLNPIPQLLQIEFLIRGMQPVVRQPDPGEDHRRAGRTERRHDGDRSASACRNSAPPRDLLEGPLQEQIGRAS